MADVVTVYKDDAGEWRWRRRAANGETISDSGEGYTRRVDAERAANRANNDETLDYIIEGD